MGLGPPSRDHLTLCNPPTLQEKCVNCSRKFRCTQGFQLEVRLDCASHPRFACSHCPQLCSPRSGALQGHGLSTPW